MYSGNVVIISPQQIKKMFQNPLSILLRDVGGSGGALVHSGEISTLISVTFSNNLAGGNGPAVLSLGAIVEMANCTFTGNTFFCEPGTYLEVMIWSTRIECVSVNAGKGFVP